MNEKERAILALAERAEQKSKKMAIIVTVLGSIAVVSSIIALVLMSF